MTASSQPASQPGQGPDKAAAEKLLLLRQFKHKLEPWARSTLASLYLDQGASLCDVLCGPGLNLDTFQAAGVGSYLGVDHAEQCVAAAQHRWKSNPNFGAQAFPARWVRTDPSKYCLKDTVDKVFDNVVCFGRLEHNFSKGKRAMNFINNISLMLRPGGIFFGLTLDTATVSSKLRDARTQGGTTRTGARLELANLEFSPSCSWEQALRPYGVRYTVRTVDGSRSTQFMVHTAELLALCHKVGLRCLHITNLKTFFQQHKEAFPCCPCEPGMPCEGSGCDQPWSSEVLELASLHAVIAFQKTAST